MTDHHALPVLVRIGKAGITETVIDEIKKHLQKRKIVKIKFLPAHAAGKDKRRFARELAEKTGAKLVHQVGFVVVLGQNAGT